MTTEFSEGDYDIRLDDNSGAWRDRRRCRGRGARPVVQPDVHHGQRRVTRLGIFKGEFHWHNHDDDEFFFVLDGELVIDVEGRDSVRLSRHQSYTVPRTVMHARARRAAP